MRKKIIAGNWKMNCTPAQAEALCRKLLPLCEGAQADVVFCVPSVDIPAVTKVLAGSSIAVGAQNMYFEEKGAFTGEISADMLLELGVKYVIFGHSERREYFGETDEMVNRKVKKALSVGLLPIVCCGETLAQREAGIAVEWIRMQVKLALQGISTQDARKITIAYEPIWAIGTGKTATANQAQEICGAIRKVLSEIYDQETAQTMRIQYGGSVNGKNAAELFAMPDIDGGLVGDASLKEEFAVIAHSE